MTSTPIDPSELDVFGALHRKAAQQAAVAELGRRALTGADVPQLLEEAVAAARDALGTERVAILQLNDDGLLHCVAHVGWRREEMQHTRPSDESQVGFTFLHGESLVVVDYLRDERFAGSRHLAQIGIASGISAPIRGDESPVGVLVAHARTARTFSDDDVLFLRGIANVLAAALARERADAARLRSEERLAFLADASERLTGSLDQGQTLSALADLVAPALAALCVPFTVHGDTLVAPDGTACPWPSAFAREELAAGTPLVLPSAPTLAPLGTVPEGHALVALPLLVDGEVSAVAFAAVEAAAVDGQDLELLAEVGRRASLAFENAAAHAAESLARTRAESLQRVTSRLAGALEPDEVVATVLEEVVDVTGAASGLVALVDEGHEKVTVIAERGFDTAPIDEWRTFDVDGPYPVSHVVRSGEPVYFETIAARNELFPVFADVQRHPHASVALPLAASAMHGAIYLSYPDERPFDTAERAFLETIARQCAQTLERTKLRSELARERRLFETVLRNMPTAVIVGELPSLRIVIGNEQVETLWRRSLDEVRAENRYETFAAFHADGRPFTRDDWPLTRLAATGEPIDGELMEIERGDGTHGFVRVSAAPIRDANGDPQYGVVLLNDVTAETLARQEAEGRAHAARALEFVGDGVCLVDRGGVVRLWNRAAHRITGVAAEQAVDAPLEDALPGWAEIAAEVPVVEAGSGRAARPLTLPLDVDGRELWLSTSGVSFREGIVYAFRDVTEEHQLERMKSDFIATVSHELRTPLAAIYGAATTLRQRAGLEIEQREAFLGMIEEQSERLTQIVTDILTASRAEAGELGVEVAPVDPDVVVQQVVELAARASSGRVTAEVAAETPRVLADADRLRQVLGNVVENALKYSPSDAPVSLHVEPRDGRVVFAVEDRGPGIPAGEEERIFQKFFRLDANMRSGVSGTGLGLYICRELVERMNGTIAVESTQDGTTFTVELPAART